MRDGETSVQDSSPSRFLTLFTVALRAGTTRHDDTTSVAEGTPEGGLRATSAEHKISLDGAAGIGDVDRDVDASPIGAMIGIVTHRIMNAVEGVRDLTGRAGQR